MLKVKVLLLAVFIFVAVNSVCADNFRLISIFYENSMRIPYNSIQIDITERGKEYLLHVVTKQMQGQTGFESSNTDSIIKIEATFFNDLFSKALSLDVSRIISLNLNTIGLDGSTMNLKYGNYQNYSNISIWSPDYNTASRGLGTYLEIIRIVFDKCSLSKWI